MAKVKRSTALKELHSLPVVFRVARKVYRYTNQNSVADIEKLTVPKRKKQILTAAKIRASLDTAALLKHQHPNVQWLLPVAISGPRSASAAVRRKLILGNFGARSPRSPRRPACPCA